MELNYKKIVTEYLGCEIKTDINYFDICEMQCYNESTADGYDVYVLKYTKDDISITENVYYYDHEIAEEIMRCIDEDRIDSIFIEDYLYEDIYMDDKFEEYFNEHVEDIVSDSPDSFTEEELKYVKKDYLDEVDED